MQLKYSVLQYLGVKTSCASSCCHSLKNVPIIFIGPVKNWFFFASKVFLKQNCMRLVCYAAVFLL